MSEKNASDAPSETFVFQRGEGPGCLVQAVWFIFVGWWLGALAIVLAWILNITVIGLPLGMALLNNIPKVLALQKPQTIISAVSSDGSTTVIETGRPQMNFLIRALFFVLIGWWWSGIWLSIAYVLSATIILLPIGLPMFRMTPMMTNLKRY